MSSLGDAMTRRIKQQQGDMTPEQQAAAEAARKKAAEDAAKVLKGNNWKEEK